MDRYKIEDNILCKKQSLNEKLYELIVTIVATELEMEIWRRRNKFSHSHEKIAIDLHITVDASRATIKRLNRKVNKKITLTKIRGGL